MKKEKISKVYVVTGASSGIGLATAKELVKHGHKVYGIARNVFEHEDFKCFACDVNNSEGIKQIFEEIHQKEKRIDGLVNCAGYGIAGAIETSRPESIYGMINTNLSALITVSSISLPYLKETKGRIINISSVGGIAPLPFQACYSASKAGVLIFSKALNNEVKQFGVKVTAIMPGDIKTGFTSARVIEKSSESYASRDKKSIKKMENFEQKGGKDPSTVAKAICKTLMRKHPPLQKALGFEYKLVVGLISILPSKLVNFLIRVIYC